MNVGKVISELKSKYPSKKIILNSPENPTEIICEIDPTQNNKDDSLAIAIIDESKPHYHKKATEFYEALRGNLIITIDKKKYKLEKGEKITVKPGKIHSAQGNETWVSCLSKPGWKPEDHILVKQLSSHLPGGNVSMRIILKSAPKSSGLFSDKNP